MEKLFTLLDSLSKYGTRLFTMVAILFVIIYRQADRWKQHKLVRWRMVLHECSSWPIIYLQDLNNNRASSALELFCTGVNSFGLALRKGCDHGMEDTDYRVLPGIDRPGLIRWSVHNHRTDRVWAELNRVLSFHFSNNSKGSRNYYRFSIQGRQTQIQLWQRGVLDSSGAGDSTIGNISARNENFRISEDGPLSKWL